MALIVGAMDLCCKGIPRIAVTALASGAHQQVGSSIFSDRAACMSVDFLDSGLSIFIRIAKTGVAPLRFSMPSKRWYDAWADEPILIWPTHSAADRAGP